MNFKTSVKFYENNLVTNMQPFPLGGAVSIMNQEVYCLGWNDVYPCKPLPPVYFTCILGINNGRKHTF